MLRRIIYLSTASWDVDDDDMHTLFQKAQTNNHKDQISGLSVFHKGTFIQVLEGPDDKLDACFERIKSNPMHHDIMVVNDSPVEKRVFTEWSMAYRPLQDKEKFLHRQFNELKDIGRAGVFADAEQDVIVSSFLKTFLSDLQHQAG